MPEASNWGRWGAEDERGAVQLLTPEVVARAAGLITRGVVTDLAQPIDPGTPTSIGRPSPLHLMTRTGADYAAGARMMGRSRFSDDVYVIDTHTGTHVDSLAHVWYDEQLYNGHPQSSLRSGGAKRCGVDKLGPIVGRGVMLDVAAAQDRPALGHATPVSADDLRACAEAQGTPVQTADIVLVRTGWWGAHGADPDTYFDSEPGIDLDAGAWLAARDVAAIGADNYAVEVVGAGGEGFPVHEMLLRDHGIALIEGLVLDRLAEQHVHEFLFVANPLPLRGGTASPLAPVAIH